MPPPLSPIIASTSRGTIHQSNQNEQDVQSLTDTDSDGDEPLSAIQEQQQPPSMLSHDPSALIALQQLASISSAQSFERMLPTLPKTLQLSSDVLVYGRGKIPRLSTKRLTQYESNRCPLCSRVYRSQAFLNEHMRKEHSILI